MKRKLVSLLLAILMLAGACMPAVGANEAAATAQAAAEKLYALGLFTGTGTGADGAPKFDLDRAPTRQEAVTMLVRMLGKEAEAKAGSWQTPFTDVDRWAEPYVGYAYENGLTNGTGADTFGGSQPVNATQYLTFVLRALGYSSKTDFAWDAAWEKSDALGITKGEYSSENNAGFTRGDVAVISLAALRTAHKNDETTLMETLVDGGVVDEAAAEKCGVLPDRYARFARKMLAAGGDEHKYKLGKDMEVKGEQLEKTFGDYDAYMVYDAGSQVRTLAEALKEYAYYCLDGDYKRGIELNWPVQFRSMDSFILLTNRKGMVIGYGCLEEIYGDIYAVVTACRQDTVALVEQTRAEVDGVLAAMTEVSVEASQEGTDYVYHFSGIPDEAVRMARAFVGIYLDETNFLYRRELMLSLDESRHQLRHVEIQNPFRIDASFTTTRQEHKIPNSSEVYVPEMRDAFACALFLFYNDAGEAIAYCVSRMSVKAMM